MLRSSLLWHRKGVALRKLFAILLSISFIVSPTAVAFAQAAGTDTAPTDTAPIETSADPSPAPTPPSDFTIPGVDDTQPTSDTNAAPTSDATSPDAASAPEAPTQTD